MECRKHKHQSNNGVCPSCLRDRLLRLSNTNSYYIINRSVLYNPSSDTDSSSPSSPAVAVKEHKRAGSMSMSFAVREAFSGNHLALGGGLKKSRSMAHASEDCVVLRDSKKKKKKKTTGFWTKLLHLKGKGGGGADVGGLITSPSRQRVY